MNKTIIFDVLGRSKLSNFRNELLHSLDMFEEGKELVHHNRYEMVAANDAWKAIPEKIQEDTSLTVIFCGVRLKDEANGRECVTWFKPGVQSISMDQNTELGWTTFKNILEQLGYIVETDETMHVTKVE